LLIFVRIFGICPSFWNHVYIHISTLLACQNQRQLHPVDASLKRGSKDWLQWCNCRNSHTNYKVYKRNCRRADITHMTINIGFNRKYHYVIPDEMQVNLA